MNPNRDLNLMRWVIALLAASAGAAIAGLCWAAAAGGISPLGAAMALALGCVVGGLAWQAPLSKGQGPRGWVAWATAVAFALFALRSFCWVIYERKESLAFLSPNNLGDLPLHLTLIRYLASGVAFWPANPIYAAEGLHYPFGVDWLNSLLLLSGVDLLRGLVIVGLLGSACAGVMLWRWGGAFAMAGFLFNGGFAAWRFWQTGVLADFQAEVEWKSIPLAMFVTQRGLLYAVPAGLALLWSWRERFFRQRRGLPFWLEAMLYGTMPLFHLHTFLFLSWMLGAWGVVALWQRRWEALRQLIAVGVAAVIPATVLIWLLTGGFSAGRSIHWKPGWMQGETAPVLFWLENFGVLPLLVLLLLLELWRGRGRREDMAMVLPALGLFLLGCFVMFAAWEWDNTKLFLWCYLAVLPSLWGMISRWPLAVRALACLLLFASGAMSLTGGMGGMGGLGGSESNARGSLRGGYDLANRLELASLQEATRALPPEATFACWPTYNHPLLLLGRKAVMGYEGHLMSYGIEFAPQKERLERLMRGEPGWQQVARELDARYLFWGPREQKAYAGGDALPGWHGQLPVIAEGSWGVLYELRGQ